MYDPHTGAPLPDPIADPAPEDSPLTLADLPNVNDTEDDGPDLDLLPAELRAILKMTGASDFSVAESDPMGFALAIAVVSARRLGTPITWDDAQQLTVDEAAQLRNAAIAKGRPDMSTRSSAVAAALAAASALTPAGE